MSRRPARVTQADVARAIRAADQCSSQRVVEIAPDGTIRIVPSGVIANAQAPDQDEHPIDGEKIIDL